MYFQLSSDTGRSLYQSEYLGDNTDIIDTFLTTLLGTEGDFTFSPSSLKDNYYSRQSGAYTIEALNGKILLCKLSGCHRLWQYIYSYRNKRKIQLCHIVKTEIRILFLYMVRRPRFYYLPFQNTDQKGCKTHRKAMQSQKDFIAAVSHECKAPLAAILSSAEMIESVPNIPDTVTDHVRVIDAEVSRMSGLSVICSCSHPLMLETGLSTWMRSMLTRY